MVRVCFSNTVTRTRRLITSCSFLDLALPDTEPARQASLSRLFGGARSRRFSVIRHRSLFDGEENTPGLRVLVDVLRGAGFPTSLLIDSFKIRVGARDTGTEAKPSVLCVLLERCPQLTVTIALLLVERGSFPEVPAEEELALQRLAGLPNLSLIKEIQCPYVSGLDYSFLAPLASLCGVLNVRLVKDKSARAAFGFFSSLTKLQSLSFHVPLGVWPAAISPLSALVSLTRLLIDSFAPELLPDICSAISQLPLRELSITGMEAFVHEPTGTSPLASMAPPTFPDSLTSLTACVCLPQRNSDRSIDFFQLTMSSLENLELRIGGAEGHRPHHKCLRLGPSLSALTALRSLRIDMTGYSPQNLALPDSISQLAALTRFATKGLLGLLRLPGGSGTWDPRHERTTEDFDGECKGINGFGDGYA